MKTFYRAFYLLSIVAIFSGCAATVEDVLEDYAEISYADGIDRQDAMLIAQKNLLDSIYTGAVDILRPQIIDDEYASVYPRFWFVTFSSRKKKSTPQHHLVVIDKRTGGIIRSIQWAPERQNGFAWVFR